MSRRGAVQPAIIIAIHSATRVPRRWIVQAHRLVESKALNGGMVDLKNAKAPPAWQG
jgi:hypothetical protein